MGQESTSTSNTGLIVGVVVAIVVAILIFGLLVCILLWCKKNQRGFWKSEEEKQRDEMSSYANQNKSITSEMTITTSSNHSQTPHQPNDVELTNTSVQSLHSHTEVKDPTLPQNFKAYKDAKGAVFYVDSTTMTTSWTHPNKKKADDADGDYGSAW
jgi:cytoskeletal protein RodZ